MIPVEEVAETDADRAEPCECLHTPPCDQPGAWLAELHHVGYGCDRNLRLLLCTPCKDTALEQAAEKLADNVRCCRCRWKPQVVADLIVVVAL